MSDEPAEKDLRLAREAEGYFELGLFEEALERALALIPNESERLSRFGAAMRAECLRSTEQWEKGAGAYEDLILADPENVSAYVGLGWCRKRSGRLDLATESMERLLAANPEEGIGLYNLACYLALAGERDRALSFLRRAVRVEESYREMAQEEEDFASLRDDPGFRRIVLEVGE